MRVEMRWKSLRDFSDWNGLPGGNPKRLCSISVESRYRNRNVRHLLTGFMPRKPLYNGLGAVRLVQFAGQTRLRRSAGLPRLPENRPKGSHCQGDRGINPTRPEIEQDPVSIHLGVKPHSSPLNLPRDRREVLPFTHQPGQAKRTQKRWPQRHSMICVCRIQQN